MDRSICKEKNLKPSFIRATSPSIRETWIASVESLHSKTAVSRKKSYDCLADDLLDVGITPESNNCVKKLASRFSGSGGESFDEFLSRKTAQEQFDRERQNEAKMDLMRPGTRQRTAALLQKLSSQVKGKGVAAKKNFLLLFGKIQVCCGFNITSFSYHYYLNSLRNESSDWEQEWPEWERAIEEVSKIPNVMGAKFDLNFSIEQHIDPEEKDILDSIQHPDLCLSVARWRSLSLDTSPLMTPAAFNNKQLEEKNWHRQKHLEARCFLMSAGNPEKAQHLLQKLLHSARMGGVTEKKSFLVMFSRFQDSFGSSAGTTSHFPARSYSGDIPSESSMPLKNPPANILEMVVGDSLPSMEDSELFVWEQAVREVTQSKDIWSEKLDLTPFKLKMALTGEELRLLDLVQDAQTVLHKGKEMTTAPSQELDAPSSQLSSCRVPELKLPLEVPLKDDFRVPLGTSFKCDSREESPRSSVTGPRPLFEVDLNNARCVKDKLVMEMEKDADERSSISSIDDLDQVPGCFFVRFLCCRM